MKNKLNLINKIITITSIIIYLYLVFKLKNISYIFSLIYFLIITIYLYISGLIINEKENYNKNINLYFILYFVLLICLTTFINRNINFSINIKEYIENINLIPFKTIINFINSDTSSFKIYNLLGNICAFIPFSLLLVIKDIKYEKISNQIKTIFITVFIIEFIQLITLTGIFDIDDFILNIFGSIMFIYLINKLNITSIIRRYFIKENI